MTAANSLQRFIDAQAPTYEQAFSEIRRGRKTTHWMWFIFPQIKGLGLSETSRYYGIRNLREAQDYLGHPVLGPRLVAVCQELIALKTNDANAVFGTPDDLKLKSSMTLFAAVPGADRVFLSVLKKYFFGVPDPMTLELLSQ